MSKNLEFNTIERAWLKSLINADISECREICLLPIEDVGRMGISFAELRIENMQALLSKLEAADASDFKKNRTSLRSKQKRPKESSPPSDRPFRTHPEHFVDTAPADGKLNG